jgi:hypothetical protein
MLDGGKPLPAIPRAATTSETTSIFSSEGNPMNVRSKRYLPAWAMLGAGLLASVFASLWIRQSIDDAALKLFSASCDQLTLKLDEQLDDYAPILRGRAGFLAASSDAALSGKADPLLKSIVMVMLAAIGQHGDAWALEQIGFAGYLSKPIDSRDLRAMVAAIHGEQRVEVVKVSEGDAVATALTPVHADETADDAPVLDCAQALECMDGEMVTLLKMLPIVYDQIPVDRREIACVVSDNDIGRVKKASHRFKGDIGQIGALPAQKVCALFEAVAVSGSSSAFVALQDMLFAELDAVPTAIADYFLKGPVDHV